MKFNRIAILPRICFIVAIMAILASAVQADTLWNIGKSDNSPAEFALNDGNWAKYPKNFPADCFYIVGQSSLDDFSYIIPGPQDNWAGSKKHTFTIIFGMKKTLPRGDYRLLIDLFDSHSASPPLLQISVNGYIFVIQTPRGASDNSLDNSRQAGDEYCIDIPIEPDAFRDGNNFIEIINDSGSWAIFDSISLTGPANALNNDLKPATKILQAYTNPGLIKLSDGTLAHPVTLRTLHIGNSKMIKVAANDNIINDNELHTGVDQINCFIPEVSSKTTVNISLLDNHSICAEADLEIAPARKWEIHLIHQTHLDIGYTDTQDNVLDLQLQHLYDALDYIDKSKDYPKASQFKYHPEGMWAVDEFMRRASPKDQARLVEAARNRQIHIDAMYAQAMTGGYSEEELFELMGSAVRFCNKYDIKLDSCIQSDVPGYTWGLVTALADNGIKYISVGPNGGHRLGYLYDWADKPFYWVAPDNNKKVLFWMDGCGYSKFHGKPKGHIIQPQTVFDYIKSLENKDYPYDMVMLRYCIERDNGSPNPALSDCVRQWNEKYAWPKLIIDGNGEFLASFEKRYGDSLPVVTGDFTPYWEDGMASTAADTTVNRQACEALAQAQILWTMLNPKAKLFPLIDAAWEKLIMYDEHTWGAWNSISDPDSEFAISQAQYKASFATDGASMVNDLLSKVTKPDSHSNTIEVYNTASWPRSELIILSPAESSSGDAVFASDGTKLSSQRLSTGELAFYANNVPALGSSRYTIRSGSSLNRGNIKVSNSGLSNDNVSLTVAPDTGAVNSLIYMGRELVDTTSGSGINDYLYMLGRDDSKGFSRITGPVSISVIDNGPLVGILQVCSKAPGCNSLTRNIRLVSGSDRIEFLNITDKYKERTPEGVYFEYPFNIPNGIAHIDIPWATCQPETDQIVGANRNYYCVQRWVDLSNSDYGITWVTPDAPMLQFHPIKIASTGWFNKKDWRRKLDPTPRFYSWVMNNHWETNYKADQEGIISFRYVIEPHLGAYDEFLSQKTGRSVCQPLVAVSVDISRPQVNPIFTLDDNGIIMTSMRPSRDGNAIMLRLFNTAPNSTPVNIQWHNKPEHIWLSDTREHEISKVNKPVKLATHEVLTLRVDF